MHRRLAVPLVAALLAVALIAPAARATTTTIGETSLIANGGTLDALSPAGAPVFQGDASGNYVLAAPASGIITSWRFLSAGAAQGSHFKLRVLAPAGTTGKTWTAVATSGAVQVTTPTGVDGVNGPFVANIPIGGGDRIALEPIDNGSTPIEQSVANADGVRFFSGPFTDGTTSTVANASLADNGQVVPIQATISYTPRTLSVVRAGPGSGSIKGDVSPVISCPGACSRQYPSGTTITLRETPAAGSQFGGWSGGGCKGTATTCAVALTANTTVTATFARIPLANVSPPTISGQLGEGQTLSCQPGLWTAPDAAFRYTWYWTGQSTLTPRFTLRRGEKVIGVKKPPRSINPPVRFLQTFGQFSTTRAITVPGLAQPTSFYCNVTATTPVPESVTASSATVRVKPDPPALARDRRTLRFHPPHIQPNVGVGGANVCAPGLWRGSPRLTYGWYAILKGRHLHNRKLLHTSQAIPVAPADEGLDLVCQVTATNSGGSTTASSNHYVVKLGAPVLTAPVQVAVDTTQPTGHGVFSDRGGAVVAERIKLTCLGDNWNRSDLKLSYKWIAVDWAATPGVTPELGRTLDVDMSPPHIQFYGFNIACQVTATTSHGISSVAQSGVVTIDNGCQGEYTLENLNYRTEDFGTKFHYSYQAFRMEFPGTTGSNAIGMFGFTFEGLAQGEPRRAVTTGPNCLDYQKYYLKQGFDVRQYDPADPDWVHH